MKSALYSILLLLLLPSSANAGCTSLSLTRIFLAPLETEETKWHVSKTHFYDDPDLGFSIKFQTADTAVDFYVYDAGLEKIDAKLVDEAFGQSVWEMLQVLGQSGGFPTSDPFLAPPELLAGLRARLITNAAYILQAREPKAIVSIVSVGFDGKCFQKIRFTRRLAPEINVIDHFEHPPQSGHIRTAIYDFVDFAAVLNEELYRIGYYK